MGAGPAAMGCGKRKRRRRRRRRRRGGEGGAGRCSLKDVARCQRVTAGAVNVSQPGQDGAAVRRAGGGGG